ncbi:MAG: diphthamide biosynthesis enzyme Dph2 [Candidatus Aenigmatarchaeota archaeon]|nr:MAG: diphthamide biosynthesis enzyme Dph2 [Candidatus Aenigmarchaeota archaeon]
MNNVEGNIAELVEAVRARGAKRIFIQIPEGLLMRAQDILDAFDSANVKAFMSLEPCYGACDLRDAEAESLNCDLLVNVGHSDFGVNERIPTLYFIWKVDANAIPALEKDWQKLAEYKSIGLVSSVNFLQILPEVKAFLESKGAAAHIGKGSLMEGQVLGCNVSSALAVDARVDAFLFVGSGHFHPLGIGLRVDKPFYVLDLERAEITKPDYTKFLKQRYLALALAREAQSFAVLVSGKPGQHFVDPYTIKERLERLGKKAWIFTMDRITPDKLLAIRADAYVNTACPRITVENRGEFRKPLLNPDEFAELMRELESAARVAV